MIFRGCATMSRKRIFSSSFGSARWACSRPVVLPSASQAFTATSPLVSGARLRIASIASMSVSSFGLAVRRRAVQRAQEVDLVLRVPADALAAVAQLLHQRTDGGEAGIEVRDSRAPPRRRSAWCGRGPARSRRASSPARRTAAPVRRRCRAGSAPAPRRFRSPAPPGDVGEGLGDAFVDVPVGARFPGRIHRRGQRMDERMHVGGVEVVLLVPSGGGQHDVRVHAGGGHAEIQRHQQVEFSLRRLVVPGHVLRLVAAFRAQVLAQHAMLGAEQMLEEILVALAGGAEQVGAPDEHVARPVRRIVRIVAGEFEFTAEAERPASCVMAGAGRPSTSSPCPPPPVVDGRPAPAMTDAT